MKTPSLQRRHLLRAGILGPVILSGCGGGESSSTAAASDSTLASTPTPSQSAVVAAREAAASPVAGVSSPSAIPSAQSAAPASSTSVSQLASNTNRTPSAAPSSTTTTPRKPSARTSTAPVPAPVPAPAPAPAPVACAWPAVPAPKIRANQRFISKTGDDRNSGSALAPWRSIQGPINAGLVPPNTSLRIMGPDWTPPIGSLLLGTFGGATIPPDGLSIVPDLGYRQCVMDGAGRGQGGLIELWYPPTVKQDFEFWGFRVINWKSNTIAGGLAPVTIAGNWDGLRFIGCEWANNGADNGSLDHIFYLGGGLNYAQAARNLVISHNSFLQPVNQGNAIKIGSGGPVTAGPDGTQNPGSNVHHLQIEYNYLETQGWGGVLVSGEYQSGNPANTVLANNIIRVHATDLREFNGVRSSAAYGGPVYFTWNQAWGVGCDSSFVVRDNVIEISATDRSDWHCIYNLRAPANVTQSSPHNPTLNNNRLINRASAARLLAGAAMGTNIAGDTVDTLCSQRLLIA
jgi:hypothetical protein